MIFSPFARRLCVLLIAAPAALLPAPAGAVSTFEQAGRAGTAHPFGLPSVAKVGAEGNRVTLSWLPAGDDWVELGRSVGAFENLAAAAAAGLTGEQVLARSPAVRAYLLARVRVSQGGRACASDLAPLERLLAEGARFTFACPDPVREVDVRIGALTDLHEAYRTMLTAESPAVPEKALLTSAADTRTLHFDPSAAGGAPPVVPAVALVTAIGALAAFLVRRRRPEVRV
ncbi:hypothetical protein GCM10009850_038390 [Nonomuraea monospora]|uniref:Secreted protein n=1 Tax=Nonomuraea monospora TaxID=568818 RepID=A0ABP5P9B9_9ACTN